MTTGTAVKRILIDECGKHWFPDSPELCAYSDSGLGTDALVDFLVTNLGWIDVRLCAQTVGVHCRPRILSEIALFELMYFLADHGDRQLAVSVLGSGWSSYTGLTWKDALGVISPLQQCDQRAKYPAFLAVPIAPEISPLFARLVAVMNSVERKEQATIDDLDVSLTQVFRNQRWSISHFDDTSGRLVMDRKGRGFTPFNRDWSVNSPPTSLADYAGSEYADWIASTRKRAIEINCPIFDEVDAVVRFPVIGLSRLVYSRVTAPITLRKGQRYAISAAEPSIGVQAS